MMTPQQLAEEQGFEIETHKATTQDGYILTLFRVIDPKDTSSFLREKHPLLLQHGLSDSGETFMVNQESSLAFQLMRSGYDVWLGNSRGNQYSRDHISLDPMDQKDAKYWQFTFYEMGKYDTKA